MSEIQVGEVKMTSLESINVGERTRQEYGNLNDLEISIKESGLIQPLAVRDNGDESYTLLGGERRYLILQKNGVSLVPVRVYPQDLDPFQMKSIELAENFYRKDFEYWEYDSLVRETHELQQSIHGTKAPGPDADGWSTEDTGKMIGVSKASVSTAVKRAEAREAFPELFKGCKTQNDASKVMKRMDEMVVKEVISKKIESESPNTELSKLSKCYITGSCFEGMAKLPDSVFHLVEIDPPYAISLQASKKKDGTSKYSDSDYNEVDSDTYINGSPDGQWKGLKTLFQEAYRTMANHSWLICWFAPEPWFNLIYQELTNAGFSTTRMCGLWTKPSGQSMRPEIYLANSYEMFFYAWKGRPALNKPGRSNNFNFPPVPAQQKVHPTERPIDLMKDIYETFAFPGSRVLIPFLGSGSGILAAHQSGMTPLGFDLTKAYRDSFLIKLDRMK